MRTPRELYHGKPIVYSCELDVCPECGERLKVAYVSGSKTVQTSAGVSTIAQRPKKCMNPRCVRYKVICKSSGWQRIAPSYCTYSYDVIAQIGWQRQSGYESFQTIHADMQARLQISESQVRHLYNERYLPLLACHEREHLAELKVVAQTAGLLLSLDGLAPEGGEPQLWVVRELQLGLTLRSGWLSQQDQTTFEHFLEPIHDLGLRVAAVISDKQKGLVPAITVVFPHAKHGFCQMHYLKNASEPVAEADQAMKMELRKKVRAEVGFLIRRETMDPTGVLTVTGLIPSPVEDESAPAEEAQATPDPVKAIAEERAAIVQDLKRRIRYLLTLKGRPPLRLAGIEMAKRLTEVKTCLEALIAHHADPQLLQLCQGLDTALQSIQAEYDELRQAADWLHGITDILDPENNPPRSGEQVRQELFAYLDDISQEIQVHPRLPAFYQKIHQTTLNYASGLFHCYDLHSLPRTNNDRESEFRDLNRRLLRTTGQKGLSRRIILRQGAWELIPRPDSIRDTIRALSQVEQDDFRQERQRIRTHRNRFRFHTRSAKQSQRKLEQLVQRWTSLPPSDGP
ncbi:MAG: transposase [Candidatus Promineifilaceae bacterium]